LTPSGDRLAVDAFDGRDHAAAVRLRATQLADRLSLEVERVLRWALVKAIGWDFGREKTLILDQAARRS
jgi:hypothetical protein